MPRPATVDSDLVGSLGVLLGSRRRLKSNSAYLAHGDHTGKHRPVSNKRN